MSSQLQVPATILTEKEPLSRWIGSWVGARTRLKAVSPVLSVIEDRFLQRRICSLVNTQEKKIYFSLDDAEFSNVFFAVLHPSVFLCRVVKQQL
jgi:hypothetical protein